jgi:hypothetical protein
MRSCKSASFRCLSASAAIVFMFSLPAPLAAEERHGHAHQHGISKMKLAVDGTGLEMEIVSPGSDIVGFEHPPANAADRQAIAKAAAIFRDAAKVFAFPAGAGCRLISTEVEAPSGSGDDHDKHDEEKHGHDKHHDEKNHNAKDAKEDDHHSEFHSHYRYACGNPGKLTHIDVKLFDRFPRAREIEVEAITPSGQFARELTPSSARLNF